MNISRREYKTKQGDYVLSCLKENNGLHLTAEDIFERLRKSGTSIGRATIYRHLDRLCENGVVRRYILEDASSACYEYTGDGEGARDFHMKCVDCGVLSHMRCEYMENLYSHVLSHHGFDIDSCKTILYGRCPECVGRKEKR